MRSFAFTEQAMSVAYLALYLPLLTFSLLPGVCVIYWAFGWSESLMPIFRIILVSFAISSTYLIHQFLLPLFCGVIFRVLPIRYPSGKFPLYSWNGAKWATCNTLHRISRQHFPTYLIPSWYANLYYRIMGAEISNGAHVNSLLINDPQHVSIGRGAIIGGGAIINSHSVEGDILYVAKNNIGEKATVGLGSVLLSGACVGNSAILGARSFVPKNKTIPSGEKWAGVPAKKLEYPALSREGAK